MRLIEINVVGLQTPERAFDGPGDVILGEARFAGGHFHAEFGCDQDFLAPAALGEPVANDRLGFAAHVSGNPLRIDVSGVNHVEPRRDEGVEQLERCRLVRRPSEDVSAEYQGPNFEAGVSESALDHFDAPVFAWPWFLPARRARMLDERLALPQLMAVV